jgi:hypothetical protein
MNTLKTKFDKTQKIALMIAVSAVVVAAPAVVAITAPTAPYNTMGGQAYDIIFNKGYDSGIGFVIAGAMGLWGFMQLKSNWKETAGYGAGATGVALLPGIVTTLGFTF